MSDLRISFLPRSVSRDWVEAETPEEVRVYVVIYLS